MEVFTLNLDQFRYIRKHRINLETHFHLKIILEEEFQLTGTFVTISGEKRNIQELKNLLKEKCGDNCYNQSTSNSIPLITLSDTDSETQEGCETPKKKKKQKKHKFQCSECSTPLVTKKQLVTEGNSSEILVLNDQTAPSSKRTRFGPSSSEKYIPLCVAKNIKETLTGKINCKNKSVVNATSEEKSSFATENVVRWPSRIKVATSCRNTNLFYVKGTSTIPLISTTPCETDIACTKDDNDRIIKDTFVSDDRPSMSFTTANYAAPCKTDATCSLKDSVRIMPSFPKEKDITVLDDSIIEIMVLEGENQLTSQSKNATAQLNKMCTKPLNSLKSTKTNCSQKKASVFNKRGNIVKSSRRTVLLPKWENASQKLVTKHSLQNGVTGSNFLMLDDLADLQFPKTVNNLNSAIRNSSQMQASLFNKRNNVVKLGSRTVRLPNENQKLIVTNPKLTNGGLQNVAAGSNLSIPDGLALQFPIPRTMKLRPVVIDGTNIARAHGLTKGTYSCKGIKISVAYFLRRGHTEVTAFIPKFRKHQLHGKIPTTDANILEELEETGHIAYAPSRKVNGKTLSCYNSRFIVQLATQTCGIIVSNDNFRDIMLESEAFKKTIEERLLMFCFVGDIIMFPGDPLGKDGPRLEEFLAFPPEHSHIL